MLKILTLCQRYFDENFWYAKKTKENATRAFRYLAEVVGNINVDRLDACGCEKFRNYLLRTGRSKNTANIYLRAIRPVLQWAVQQKLIRVNPAADIKPFRVTQKPIRVYEDWEFERMYRFAPNERWRAILLAARTTGLRRGELLNLTLDNIRGDFIYVEPKRETKRTWPWEPKDREIRKVPIIDELRTLVQRLSDCYYPLLTLHIYRNMLRLKDARMLDEDRCKCPDPNFRRTFVAIQRRAFGRQIGDFHSLRKTYITEMANNLPEYFVLRLSGHSSSRTMRTYYTACRESMYSDARKIASCGVNRGMLGYSTPPKTEALNASHRWAVEDLNL